MGQTADQLKDQIEHQRQELGENLQQLEEKVKSTVDWRTQFQQKPWAGVGVAFAGGFLLSMLMPSGGSSGGGSGSKSQSQNYMANYRVMDDSQRWGQMGSSGTSSSSSGSTMGFMSGGSQKQKSSSPEMSEITETLENIRGAVMGMAATRLRGFLAEAVPGFEDEYEQARTRRGASSASKIDSTSSGSGSSSMTGGSQNSQSSQGSQSFTSTASRPSGGSSPSQTHDADTPLSGYMGSSEGSTSTQSSGTYRS